MPYYLTEWTGQGTWKNPFQARHSDQGCIDLRPDCSVRDGYALVKSDGRVRGTKLGEYPKDGISVRLRNAFHNRLGVDVSRARRFDHLAALALTRPNGWKPLRPTGWQYEIWLGGLIWSFPLLSGGSSASDDFNRANGTIQTGVPAWIQRGVGSGWPGAISVSSNQATAAGDSAYCYSGAAATADQYSQITNATDPVTSNGGPSVRVATNLNDDTWYTFDTFFGGGSIWKVVLGSLTNLTSTASTKANPLRIEAQGTTLRMYFNGVIDANYPITDSSISTGQPGIFMYGQLWDNWSGGDLAAAGTPDRRMAQRHSRGTSW